MVHVSRMGLLGALGLAALFSLGCDDLPIPEGAIDMSGPYQGHIGCEEGGCDPGWYCNGSVCVACGDHCGPECPCGDDEVCTGEGCLHCEPSSPLEAGYVHTCFAPSRGGAACWGKNTNGQLGDGSTTSSTTPVGVLDLSACVAMLAGGAAHTCAVLAGGATECWGVNAVGQLGDGTRLSRLTPGPVSGLTAGVTAIDAGPGHTCAVVGGSLKCWGYNSDGQLGDGTTTNRLEPISVVLTSEAVTVGAGARHTCAVEATGAVECWGANANGQLGDGTLVPHAAPGAVAGMAPGAVAVAAGAFHTCAVLSEGGLVCWGGNRRGQVGDGTQETRATPTEVLASGVLAVAAGLEHTCAVVSSPAAGVMCWGANDSGQLGDGSTTDRLSPVAVLGLAPDVLNVVAGDAHTCALFAEGLVQCWGANGYGQLGDGTITGRSTPASVEGL